MSLVDFWNTNKHLYKPFLWMEGRSYSEKFVICLGAGPWRIERRKKVQSDALKTLNTRDISEIKPEEKLYPLQWQNKYLHGMAKYLCNNDVSFDEFCASLRQDEIYYAQRKLMHIFGIKQLPKVLSLFCRDGLKVPAFPIDRHVKRKLVEIGIVPNEEAIVRKCSEIGLDASELAVCFVRASSNMDNPDWSI